MIAVLFALLVVATAAAVVAVVAVAARRAALGPRPTMFVASAITGWLAVTAIAAATGVVALDGGPPRLLALPWLVIAATLLGLRTPTGRALVAAAPPAAVIALQVFRVPVELVLWRLAADGRLATALTFEGRNFDVVIGLTAIPVALLAWGGRSRPRLALAWHVVGLALLVNIVAMAVLSAPGPQHALDLWPTTEAIGRFPFAWLPALLVPLAALLHVIGLRQALGARRR